MEVASCANNRLSIMRNKYFKTTNQLKQTNFLKESKSLKIKQIIDTEFAQKLNEYYLPIHIKYIKILRTKIYDFDTLF